MPVLITRPANLACGLAEKIKAMGDTVALFPTIEIKKTPHQTALQAAIHHLDTQDIAIFISQAAVTFGIPAIKTRWSLLPNLRFAAIGASTARALQVFGISEVIFPSAPPYESESLLAQSPFQTTQIQGKKIAIFRGNGGREYLSETLRSRGAFVQTIEVYQRCLPTLNPKLVEKIKHWHHTRGNVIVTTSADALYNLVKLMQNANAMDTLTEIPLVVVGARMQKLAKDLKFKYLKVATGADDASIINVLQAFKKDIDL